MNEELAKIFDEMSVLLALKEVAFKPQAFEKAAHSLGTLSTDVRDIYKKKGLKGLKALNGIGQSIAEHIEEYIKTGHIKEYEKLKKALPVNIEELSAIEGVGPKMIQRLYKEFNIKTVSQLEKAAKAGKLHGHTGIGERTEQKILRGIAFQKQGHGRFALFDILPGARIMCERIKVFPGVEQAEIAGSIRRMQETVGDLDILAIAEKPSTVIERFIGMPEVKSVQGKGDTKATVRLRNGMRADIRVLKLESFGAALQYFTGDKYHNVQVRERAIKKGYTLNEYGLFKGKRFVAGRTEEEIYKKLGMEWIPPEIRTARGEIEASQKGALPDLVGYDDLKGDLQIQTDWTDGVHSIKEMAEAAKERGLEYIAITDHTKNLPITGGSDDKRLLKQMAEIDRIQKKMSGFKILKGVEVDILKDGTLDISDEVLEKLDVVGASVHTNKEMSEKDMTVRIIRAMENPHVDILFHPTGRIVKSREPYKVDMEQLFKAAKRTKTVLEANASQRLDLKDEHIRTAVDMGINIAISSDAHRARHFDLLEYGIAQARRGWAEKKDVINTRGWKEMLKCLK